MFQYIYDDKSCNVNEDQPETQHGSTRILVQMHGYPLKQSWEGLCRQWRWRPFCLYTYFLELGENFAVFSARKDWNGDLDSQLRVMGRVMSFLLGLFYQILMINLNLTLCFEITNNNLMKKRSKLHLYCTVYSNNLIM